MQSDLSGGIPTEREFVLAEKPAEAEFRDAVNTWIEEENGQFGMRIGVESNSSRWDLPEIYLDVAFPDGRVISRRSDDAAHQRLDDDGKPTILGAGPLRFQIIEPFAVWKVSFDGDAAEITADDLIRTPYPEETVMRRVQFEIVMTMAVPPWQAGDMLPEEAKSGFAKSATYISPRYEQLFRCEGRMTIGDEKFQFKGQGLRIRRQGLRQFADFPGHVWQSCLFSSGKAFGLNTFGTADDAAASYAEAYYYDGQGSLKPARIVQAPWMVGLAVRGDDVPIRLDIGGTEISLAGKSFINCRSRFPAALPPDFPVDYPVIQQSHVHYTLDGENATGMMERSTPPSKLRF
jgi:hypothetical protein